MRIRRRNRCRFRRLEMMPVLARPAKRGQEVHQILCASVAFSPLPVARRPLSALLYRTTDLSVENPTT